MNMYRRSYEKTLKPYEPYVTVTGSSGLVRNCSIHDRLTTYDSSKYPFGLRPRVRGALVIPNRYIQSSSLARRNEASWRSLRICRVSMP